MNTEQAIEKIKEYAKANWGDNHDSVERKSCIDGGSYVILHPEEFGLTKTGWIKVQDGLPNPGTEVFVFDQYIGMGHLLNDSEKEEDGYTQEQIVFDSGDWFHASISVTHWMNKPEPLTTKITISTEQEIAEIIEGQYNGFRGLKMIELGKVHDKIRIRVGDEKYLQFLKDQQDKNPKPVYKPLSEMPNTQEAE